MKFPFSILVTVFPVTLKSAAVNSFVGAVAKTTVALLVVISLIALATIGFSTNVISTLTLPFTTTFFVASS